MREIHALCLSVAMVTTINCANNLPLACSDEGEVISATETFIRLRHTENAGGKADDAAAAWCGENAKRSKRSGTTCTTCCVTSYQCIDP